MRHAWMLLAVALGAGPDPATDAPARRYEVVTPKDDGIIATAINGRGDIVGFEWVELQGAAAGIVTQQPFFARGKDMIVLPLLEGYTATFPAAVSDTGLVVGRASRPGPLGVRVDLRNQAFVWDTLWGIRGLGTLEGDRASFATGISRDGRRISGISVGPERIRACLWERAGDDAAPAWKATPLPQAERLGANTVAISDDGTCLASVDGAVPCLWTRQPAGTWTRETIGEPGTLVPRAVNNTGTVAGVRFTPDGLCHAVVWSRDQGMRRLEKPAGYVRSEASAVNNDGVVVGMADGPNGSPIGPSAFVYVGGRLRLIDEGGPAFTAATAINDRGQVAGVFEKDEEVEPVKQKKP
jgi:probable HAF family extracellular repeat protein